MRGIVELEILKAIEMELPLKIPIISFFDLIVGTRFVHLLSSLALQIWQHVNFILLRTMRWPVFSTKFPI